MKQTIAASLRVVQSGLRTRSKLYETRVATELNDTTSLTQRTITVDSPRALGPVNQVLMLQGSESFILETSHPDSTSPTGQVTVKTKVDKLYVLFGTLITASVLPDPSLPSGRTCEIIACFG